MQIVAVSEQGGVNAFFNNELSQLLITEGNTIADKLRAHFATGSDDEGQFKFASFAPFLKEVWDKKPEIEHAFNLEEPLTIDSGEGTMEHSMHHHHQQQQQQQLKADTVSQSQSSLEEINCWIDDGFLIQKQDNKQSEDLWKNMNAHHAFTTGRRPNQSSFAKKIRPKGPSQTLKQPGKLNLKSFAIVNEAIARMNIGGGGAGAGGDSGPATGNSGLGVPMTEKEKKKAKKLLQQQQAQLEHAPLAAPEDDSEEYEDEAGYEQINDAFSDAVNNVASQLFTTFSGGPGGNQVGGRCGADSSGGSEMGTHKTKLRQRREKEQSKLNCLRGNRFVIISST
uniref:PG2 pseudoGTPase domain-containing protein n=1 Tax=Anopheles maculatus TaxID=74869 RepID=A0A182S9R8_9DIPT